MFFRLSNSFQTRNIFHHVVYDKYIRTGGEAQRVSRPGCFCTLLVFESDRRACVLDWRSFWRHALRVWALSIYFFLFRTRLVQKGTFLYSFAALFCTRTETHLLWDLAEAIPKLKDAHGDAARFVGRFRRIFFQNVLSNDMEWLARVLDSCASVADSCDYVTLWGACVMERNWSWLFLKNLGSVRLADRRARKALHFF